jgi:hypothetical protein
MNETAIRKELVKMSMAISAISALLTGEPVTPAPTEKPTESPTPAPGDKTMVRIPNNQWIESYGQCGYVTQEYLDRLLIISQQLQAKYPLRQAKILEIADACPQDGLDCPHGNHPAGTHWKGWGVDKHYYTLGSTNHTEKDPRGEGNIVHIWDDDGNLTPMFDPKRELDFLLDYIAEFPAPYIVTDPKIKLALVLVATAAEAKIINEKVSVAGGHETHIHLGYQGEIK